MRSKSKTVTDPTHLNWFSKIMAMLRTDVIVLHCTIFKTSCSGIHGIPPFSFSRERIGFLVNSMFSVKSMSVSKPLALISPLLFRCSSPTTSPKNRKKIVLIYSYVNLEDLNNNSVYRNTPASADDWKRPENRKATTVRVRWSRVKSITFEGHVTLWSFLVALLTQRVPDSGQWLYFRVLYGSQ